MMKAKSGVILVLVALLAVQFIQETDAWFGRLGKICKHVCDRTCEWVVRKGFGRQWVCKFLCKRRCDKRKKRALGGPYHVTSLPANFDFYDLDDDNFIEVGEFASTLGHQVDELGLVKGFNLTDVNGDGKMSFEEFNGQSSAFYIADPFSDLDRLSEEKKGV